MKKAAIACLWKNILFSLACVLAVVSCMLSSRTAFVALLAGAGVFFVLGVVVSVAFYRCPYCRRALSKGARLPARCPHCGEKLR